MSLQASVEEGRRLGKLALYFGCLRGLGHFLHNVSWADTRCC